MNKLKISIFFTLFVLIIGLTGCGNVKKTEDIINTGVPVTDNTTKPDCEPACANYVDKCLTLVPGATQQLYVDGHTTCLEECKEWKAEKTQCMADAENCTLMTEECKL